MAFFVFSRMSTPSFPLFLNGELISIGAETRALTACVTVQNLGTDRAINSGGGRDVSQLRDEGNGQPKQHLGKVGRFSKNGAREL